MPTPTPNFRKRVYCIHPTGRPDKLFYIGETGCSLEGRMRRHYWFAFNEKSGRRHLPIYERMRELGRDGVEARFLDEFETEDAAIDHYGLDSLTNVRRSGGSCPTGLPAKRIDWDAYYDELRDPSIGDRELARRIGCNQSTVSRKRRSLGIPARNLGPRYTDAQAYTIRLIYMTGGHTQHELADLLGVSQTLVSRIARGAAPYQGIPEPTPGVLFAFLTAWRFDYVWRRFIEAAREMRALQRAPLAPRSASTSA